LAGALPLANKPNVLTNNPFARERRMAGGCYKLSDELRF